MATNQELRSAKKQMQHLRLMLRAHNRHLDYMNIKAAVDALVKTHGITQTIQDNITFNNHRRVLDLWSREATDIIYTYGLIQARIYRNGFVEISFA